MKSRLSVSADLDHGNVDIKGYLTKGEIVSLESDISDLVQRYQNVVKVNLDLKDALASLPFKISAIHAGGDFPMIVTEDGQKIYQGGEVDGDQPAHAAS